jgi:hypothetical protein
MILYDTAYSDYLAPDFGNLLRISYDRRDRKFYGQSGAEILYRFFRYI